jgi:hypothetical protein
MRIKVGLAAIPLFCALFAGCGGELTTSAPPAAEVTTGTGNWLISGFYQVGQSFAGYSFSGSLVNDSGQLNGVFHIDQPCFGSGATDVPYSGTVDAKNTVTITSVPVNGQVLTFKGLLAADGSTITQGSFKISGGCTGSIVSGTFPEGPGVPATLETSAYRLPSLTGLWIVPTSLSENLTQSSAPDAHGDYALTGTVSVQGSPCFTQGTLQPGSFVSGVSGQQIIKMNDGSVLQATLSVSYNGQLSSSILGLSLHPGSVSGGACDGPI